MFPLISILWFTRTTKINLFYLYLWQLKEYHILRFIDHFRTEKGKRLLFDKIVAAKIIILLFFFLAILFQGVSREAALRFFLIIISALYLAESIIAIKNFSQRKLKLPVVTIKTGFFVVLILFFQAAIIYFLFQQINDIYIFTFWLLFFDIISPAIVSFLILISQPFAVIVRYWIINRAKQKIKQFPNLKVIGITGSYGKTSTKEFIKLVLSEKYKVLSTKQHQNSEMGISRCILSDLKPDYEVFVVEMGAYGKGGIKLLSDIVKPRIGVLTGINEQHMALFGSQEKIKNTKYELIESLPQNGLAIFNGDNKYCLELYNKTNIRKKIYQAEKSKGDAWAENIKVEKEKVSFRICTKEGESMDIELNVLGRQNISNVLAAAAVAKELGMNLKEIAWALMKIKPEQGSMEIIKGKDDPYVIDSSYSANPDGVIADLDYLKVWSGKKIIVMPCLIELGSASSKIHKRIGRKIGEVCVLAIITTKERFEDIKAGAIESGITPQNIFFIENPEQIVNQIKHFSTRGDVVLLEGRVPREVIKSLSGYETF